MVNIFLLAEAVGSKMSYLHIYGNDNLFDTKLGSDVTKKDLIKKLPFSSTFLEVHFLLGTNQSRAFSVEQIVSEFSEQPTEVITDGDDENEDEEYNV